MKLYKSLYDCLVICILMYHCRFFGAVRILFEMVVSECYAVMLNMLGSFPFLCKHLQSRHVGSSSWIESTPS